MWHIYTQSKFLCSRYKPQKIGIYNENTDRRLTIAVLVGFAIQRISLTFIFFQSTWRDICNSTSLVIHVTESYERVITYIMEITSLNIETYNMKCLDILKSHKVWQQLPNFEHMRLRSFLGFSLLKPDLANTAHTDDFTDMSSLKVQRDKCIWITHVCNCLRDLLLKAILYVTRLWLKIRFWDPVIFCSLFVSILWKYIILKLGINKDIIKQVMRNYRYLLYKDLHHMPSTIFIQMYCSLI